MLADRSRPRERLGEALFYVLCSVPAGCAALFAIVLIYGSLIIGSEPRRESTLGDATGVNLAALLAFPIVVFVFGGLPAKVRHRGYIIFYASWATCFVLSMRFIASWLD